MGTVLYEEKNRAQRGKAKREISHFERRKEMIKIKSVFTAVIVAAACMVLMAAAGTKGTVFAASAEGSKLPADGGEPGKDYMSYVKAVHNRDGATIRKLAEVPPGTSDEELKGQMGMAAAMTPTDQKIVSGTMNEDRAVLKVTGMLEGKQQYGKVEMQKRGGVWKITKEEWSETEKK